MERTVAYLRELLNIDSTTGFFSDMDEYLLSVAKRLGFPCRALNKGGVVVELGGEGNPVTIAAHADDIGLMVRRIEPNGTITVANVGGLRAFYALDWNCRIHAQNGKVYTGTMRKKNACIHSMTESERNEVPDYDKNLVLVLDEDVSSKEDVLALGIACGDQVAVETRFTETESGYIKSRYLDDKASCACLLRLMELVQDGTVTLSRKTTLLFTEYEEIGHGGAAGIPLDTKDFIAVDIGCVGPNNLSDEHKVTIGVKDASFPYHTVLKQELVALCEQNGIPYELDMMLPSYGSDADVALRAGFDVRHALIGPGVLETHGYERTHKSALDATLRLLVAVVRA